MDTTDRSLINQSVDLNERIGSITAGQLDMARMIFAGCTSIISAVIMTFFIQYIFPFTYMRWRTLFSSRMGWLGMGLVGGAFCFLAVILGILVCILLYRAKTLDPDYYLLFGKPIYGFEGWSHEEKGNKLLELGQRQKHLRKISAVILWVQVSFLVMGGGLSIFVLRYYWTIYGVVYKNR